MLDQPSRTKDANDFANFKENIPSPFLNDFIMKEEIVNRNTRIQGSILYYN